MACPLTMIGDIKTLKQALRIAVRIIRVWVLDNPPYAPSLEMILMDSKGDKIHASVREKDLFSKWKGIFKEDDCYDMQNFIVQHADGHYRNTAHPFKLSFSTGTIAKRVNCPEIPLYVYNFTSFEDILSGKASTDVLVEIIGQFTELGKHYGETERKKVIISLKDQHGKILKCTLWEAYAAKLVNYINNKGVPVIIILTLAKIHEATDNYPITISNSKWSSELIINEDIKEINDYKASLTSMEVYESGSQMQSQISGFSQLSQYSQFTTLDRFFYKADVMSLADICTLRQDTQCCTIATIENVLAGYGWSYDHCLKCNKAARNCGCGDQNTRIETRFRVEVMVSYRGDSTNFVLWDNDCKDLLNITAAELRKQMMAAGEQDPMAIPTTIDKLEGKTMAFKIKVQPRYRRSSVVKLSEGKDIIEAVLKRMTDEQVTIFFGPIMYPTYREACFAMGFLQDDREYIEAIKEANNWGSGIYLRKLFVTMLISNSISRPEHVWKETWKCLVDGILYQQIKIAKIQDMQLSDLELQNLALVQIEELLQAKRKSLRDYPCMPFPEGMITSNLGNRLIYAERNYDKSDMREQFLKCFNSLTDEQSKIFETIMRAVNDQNGAIFFLEGFGGSGKTFMWNTFATDLRSRGDVVLTTASSGIASLLLPGGKTAHSKFAIPVPTLKNSICNIHQGSELAELLKITKLIIWDEAPMANKFCFEALDKSLRDIMSFSEYGHKLFGGKVIVFGGDFRQILPVVPRGCRSDIINATINSSYIWDSCTVLKLTKNMRLQNGGTNSNLQELSEFSEWLLQVGDGKLSEPNDGYADIKIPDEFLIKDFKDPIHAIVQNTYPNIVQNYKNEIFLKGRAILASTIQVVDELNDYILSIIPGEEKEYLSSDSVDMSDILADDAIHALTPEFLNTLRTSGIPNHRIKLKIGTPIMLMRNLDQSERLCNGTRLIVTRLANHVIEAKIISGKNVGNLTYIPRMSFSPSDSPWPFKLIRRQFPIITSYAMTINKSQGQSLANVGLYLPNPVFSHGQLYVAFSRVQSKKGLKILIHDKDKKPLCTTTNVVFKEVFQNLR